MTKEDITSIINIFLNDGGTIGDVQEVLNELTSKDDQECLSTLGCASCEFYICNRCKFPGCTKIGYMGRCSGYTHGE